MPIPTNSMTAEQRRLVRDSFDSLREISGPIARLFYGRLFELAPAVRPLFHNDIDAQGRKLMDMLSSIVESLDNFDSIRPKLVELGRNHATYGVRDEQYDVLKTALLWTLSQALGADFDDRTSEAWSVALTAVNEVMMLSSTVPGEPCDRRRSEDQY
jgi:hemoglobin-like flavoprotein